MSTAVELLIQLLAGVGFMTVLIGLAVIVGIAVQTDRLPDATPPEGAPRVRGRIRLATGTEPRTEVPWVRLAGEDYVMLESPDPVPSSTFPVAAVLVTFADYRHGRIDLEGVLHIGFDGMVRKGWPGRPIAHRQELATMGTVTVDVVEDWQERVARTINQSLDPDDDDE